MSCKECFMIFLVLLKALLWQQQRKGAGGEKRDEGTRGRGEDGGGCGGLAGPVSSLASWKYAFWCCRGCRSTASGPGSAADRIPPAACTLDLRMAQLAGQLMAIVSLGPGTRAMVTRHFPALWSLDHSKRGVLKPPVPEPALGCSSFLTVVGEEPPPGLPKLSKLLVSSMESPYT